MIHTYGRYACPHLTAEAGGDEQVITAEQCRAFAHRPAPTGSPRDMQHWQACNACPHKAASAPSQEPNKDAILNEPDAVRGIAGISIVTGVEDFVITPFEAKAEVPA